MQKAAAAATAATAHRQETPVRQQQAVLDVLCTVQRRPGEVVAATVVVAEKDRDGGLWSGPALGACLASALALLLLLLMAGLQVSPRHCSCAT